MKLDKLYWKRFRGTLLLMEIPLSINEWGEKHGFDKLRFKNIRLGRVKAKDEEMSLFREVYIAPSPRLAG